MRFDASREALYHPELKPVFVDMHSMPPFQIGHSGFSLSNAWWLSNASHLAYYEVDDLERELHRVDMRLVDFFDETSTQAYLAASDSFAILAFRGTESDNIADLEMDADIRLRTFGTAARAHRGFTAALDEIWQGLDEGLRGLGAQGLPIWYTGHSLGAALATLAAARRKPAALFTFGSPRVGDQEFVRLLDGVAVQRIVNCSDMAVTVPDRLLGYRHVGEHVFFTARAKLHLNPSPSRVFISKTAGTVAFFATLPWFRRGVVTVRAFVDHAIVNYTAALFQAIARDSEEP